MEQPEVKEKVATVSASGNDAPAPVTSAARPAASSLAPQACPTCGTAPATNGGTAAAPSYVYAIGRIEPRFPANFRGERICPGGGEGQDRGPHGPAGAARRAFQAGEPLPGAAVVLGDDDRGPGNLHPGPTRPRRLTVCWWKPCVPRLSPGTWIASSGFEGPSPGRKCATG